MNKSTRILLIAFVGLLAIYFLFFRGKDKVSTEKLDEKLFTADSSKIEKIEIVKNNEAITLEKVNSVWMMTKPVNYLADTSAVFPMLSNLKRFTLESVASTNPAKFSTYLDSVNNAKVTVYQDGKPLGTFIMGKSAAGESSYIMKPDEQRVLIASGLLAGNFTKASKDYRDKIIMVIPSFTISKMDFKSTDSNKVDFSAVKDTAGKWFVGKDSIASAVMESYLNQFAVLRTDDFKDSTITTFPVPTYSITVNLTNSQPVVINMYKDNSGGYIVQVTGKIQLYRFSDGVAAAIIKKKTDFIPPPKTETKTDTKTDTKTKSKK